MDFWFIFKKIVSAGLTPLTISLEFVVIGFLLITFSRTRTKKKPKPFMLKFKGMSGDLGSFFIVCGVLFLYLCSVESVSNGLSQLLERKYSPLAETDGKLTLPGYPEFIVVLPGGDRYGEEKPNYSRLRRKTFLRLTRGVQIWKQFPEADLVFSGKKIEVYPMRDLAIEMGVDPARIVEEVESRDTKDHARHLKSLLQDRSFLLVTSAMHMPRSMALFQGQGLRPTAAPTDFQSGKGFSFSPGKLVPRARYLMTSDEAFHEHIGLAWAYLRDQIKKKDGGNLQSAGD